MIAIIIVNWNRWELTQKCLLSLEESKTDDCEIIIVDNGSKEWVDLGERKNFSVIRLNRNLGFVRAVNIGLRAAYRKGCKYFVLLNNDTVVEKDFISYMLSTMEEDGSIGITAPAIYLYDDRDKIWQSGFSLDKSSGSFIPIRKKDSIPYEVDLVSGCAMIIRRCVLEKIGLLDSIYFTYSEDMDFCWRTKLAGYKIVVNPRAKVFHVAGASSNSYVQSYFAIRNTLLFISLNNFFDFSFAWRYSYRWALSILNDLRYRDWQRLSGRWLGFVDFVFCKYGVGRNHNLIRGDIPPPPPTAKLFAKGTSTVFLQGKGIALFLKGILTFIWNTVRKPIGFLSSIFLMMILLIPCPRKRALEIQKRMRHFKKLA